MQLVKKGGKFTFMVDGKPFLILVGGQVNNDRAFPDRGERVWLKLKAINANTVGYPVYWNEIEREEGKFDFRDFDRILRRARAEGFRVVMLWFGRWKNGAMDWAPNWVKSDVTRFPRVLDSGLLGSVRAPPSQSPTPSARVPVGELGTDEFLIIGFYAAVDIRPTVGSGFTAAQFLQVEEGVYENGVWKTTNVGRTYQGSYSPPSVSLPAQGAIFGVKLMRY